MAVEIGEMRGKADAVGVLEGVERTGSPIVFVTGTVPVSLACSWAASLYAAEALVQATRLNPSTSQIIKPKQ